MKKILQNIIRFFGVSVSILLFGNSFSNAQTVTATQNFTAIGNNSAMPVININVANDITVNQGNPIVGITILSMVDGFELTGFPISATNICGEVYGFNLLTDGTTIINDGCSDNFDSFDVSTASVIDIVSFDKNFGQGIIPIDYNLTITVILEITYSTCDVSAGIDGTLTPCFSESINLFDGINGSYTAGGDWYAPDNSMLNNSQINSGNDIGQYTYMYVISGTNCSDTSYVTLNVQDCTDDDDNDDQNPGDNNPGDDGDDEDDIDDDVSVDKNEKNHLSVYPNPVNSTLFIDDLSVDAKVEVLDLSGKSILSFMAKHKMETIDMSLFKKGMYILNINEKDNIQTIRFIKN